jgi:hypothetical protein
MRIRTDPGSNQRKSMLIRIFIRLRRYNLQEVVFLHKTYLRRYKAFFTGWKGGLIVSFGQLP